MLSEKRLKVLKTILVILGSAVCAFANVIFLKPLEINAGGLNGIGIIVSHFIDEGMKDIVYNIVIDILSVLFWILGAIFLGKHFALKTLLSSIVFPLVTALFTIVPGPTNFANFVIDVLTNYGGNGSTIGTYLLNSVTGGVVLGFGVGITFVGGGSTGGVDVLSLLLEKYANLKESVGSFLVDGLNIFVGMVILCSADARAYLMPCIVGILSVAVSSIMIDVVYVRFNINYQCDIISEEWEKISRYVQDILGKGATIIPVKGAYKLQDRIMLRVVLTNTQYHNLKSYIAEIDPSAFITVAKTRTVFGEGFTVNRKSLVNNGNKKV